VGMSIEPDIFWEVVWIAERMWPRSFVCVTRTSGLVRNMSVRNYTYCEGHRRMCGVEIGGHAASSTDLI
jgi:hypothetical protein